MSELRPQHVEGVAVKRCRIGTDWNERECRFLINARTYQPGASTPIHPHPLSRDPFHGTLTTRAPAARPGRASRPSAVTAASHRSTAAVASPARLLPR